MELAAIRATHIGQRRPLQPAEAAAFTTIDAASNQGYLGCQRWLKTPANVAATALTTHRWGALGPCSNWSQVWTTSPSVQDSLACYPAFPLMGCSGDHRKWPGRNKQFSLLFFLSFSPPFILFSLFSFFTPLRATTLKEIADPEEEQPFSLMAPPRGSQSRGIEQIQNTGPHSQQAPTADWPLSVPIKAAPHTGPQTTSGYRVGVRQTGAPGASHQYLPQWKSTQAGALGNPCT